MARFCGLCGAPLDSVTGLCPNCNEGQVHMAPVNADDQVAADVQETDAVVAATPGVASAPDMARPRKSAGRVVAVVGGLVLLVALVAGLLVIGDRTGVLALTTQGKVTRQLSLGQRYLLEEDYEQAVIAFNKAIELDPRQARAYEGLIDVYMAWDDYEAAIKIWQDGAAYMSDLSEEEQAAYTVYQDELEQVLWDLVDAEEELEGKAQWADLLTALDPEISEDDITVAAEVQLVTDAVTYTRTCPMYDYTESLLTYRIPQINLPGDRAAAVNQEIYDTFYEPLESYDGAYGSLPVMDNDPLSEIDYEWRVADGIISVVIERTWITGDLESAVNRQPDYTVYNVNQETGEPVSDDELLASYGTTEEEFQALVREAVESDESLPYYGDDIVEQLLSDQNIHAARPYIGDAGGLWFVVTTYAPWASAMGESQFDTGLQAQNPGERTTTIERTLAEMAATEEQRAVVTNETVYFTEGDENKSVQLPHINLAGEEIAAINQEIEAMSDIAQYYYVQEENILVIILESYREENASAENVDTIYRINTETGAPATDEEVLALFGLSQEDYECIIEDTLQSFVDHVWDGYMSDDGVEDYILSDENLHIAQMYINSNHQLGVLVPVYSTMEDVEKEDKSHHPYYKLLNTNVSTLGALQNTPDVEEIEAQYIDYLQNTVIPYLSDGDEELSQAYTEDMSYAFIYLDDDDIPELFYATGPSHYETVKVCTYSGGYVRALGAFPEFGAIDYYPGTGLVVCGHTGMGVSLGAIDELRHGWMHSRCSWFKVVSYTGGTVTPEDSGTIEDEDVTIEEAEQYWNDLLDGKEKRTFSWKNYSDESMPNGA